jgi:hypothetical protein
MAVAPDANSSSSQRALSAADCASVTCDAATQYTVSEPAVAPKHREQDRPALVMQFYYKTLPGFYFPGHAQPSVGTVTPYLRPRNPDGSFANEPIYGNANNDNQGDGNALGIRYRPAWPANAPVLQMAETLTLPKRGLPQVRGQSSALVFYQQSQLQPGAPGLSVRLHDPTREKIFELGAPDQTAVLGQIPGSVKTQTYQGKTYFPNLPAHLAERFFFDPTRGPHGALVFRGEFVDAPLGDKYVVLNVAGEQDRGYLEGLDSSTDNALWIAAIHNLSTWMERFVEDEGQPGTFIPAPPEPGAQRFIGDLALVTDSDVAVDSYALTATGPGTGYVSLLFGNGRNPEQTPQGDPVTVAILRVTDTLYRGEVNIVESSNPLNETLVLQQVIDLAGQVQDYDFEWKIAAPVDGLPPDIYTQSRALLLADGAWSHLRFPLPGDRRSLALNSPRLTGEFNALNAAGVVAISPLEGFTAQPDEDGKLQFSFANPHGLVLGNQVVLRADALETWGTVAAGTTATKLLVQLDATQPVLPAAAVLQLHERAVAGQPQSVLFRSFAMPEANYSQYYLSLNLGSGLGAKVYLDGQLAVTANTGSGDSETVSPKGGLVPLERLYRLPLSALAGGRNTGGLVTHDVAVELFSSALPGTVQDFNLRLEAFEVVDVTEAKGWLPLDAAKHQDGVRAVLGGSADVQSLGDNYLIMRYQANDPDHASYVADGSGGNAVWSQWTEPQLAEGWIKRVLKGINPFNQRVTDLFNNQVNTEVSILAQAGPRWEGDVALNLETINEAGLIEIYETVLNRGKMLSIGGGINYGPANDALLLAVGYLNDLYMFLGNEAAADAANPTIGIGTKDSTYGEIATALFSFKGQLPSLLEEELALLRGRDDFLLPGVGLRPVYNRMIWNYTRGIDAGEVIYALNYNILDQNTDGKVDAEDARRLYPQGHGDAYGHYLTALKGYYALLLNENFDWVPHIEAVTVLGKPVSVDYQDERKFAAAAAAVARTGRQIFDLTWRRDYRSGAGQGWDHFTATRDNSTPPARTRHWGLDHWAARTSQGSYLNWIVGNAILPDVDPDPAHEGIQKVDRTTVPELIELASVGGEVQTALDNAEGGLTPLGLPENTIPFDLNPNAVVGGESVTHFEQIYARAKGTLNNALAAFDDAKDVTRLMRSEQDSLADVQAAVARQELAYETSLIELYGSPYSDDIGPGKTWRQGYAGPDLVHFLYVDMPEFNFPELWNYAPARTFRIDLQSVPEDWQLQDPVYRDFDWYARLDVTYPEGEAPPLPHLEFTMSSLGHFTKPTNWSGRRNSPGKLQQAISEFILAHGRLKQALYDNEGGKGDLDLAIRFFKAKVESRTAVLINQNAMIDAENKISEIQNLYEVATKWADNAIATLDLGKDLIVDSVPEDVIVGTSFGGDTLKAIKIPILAAWMVGSTVLRTLDSIGFTVAQTQILEQEKVIAIQTKAIGQLELDQELRDDIYALFQQLEGVHAALETINTRLRELDDTQRRIN